jgi:hypothetical protein
MGDTEYILWGKKATPKYNWSENVKKNHSTP